MVARLLNDVRFALGSAAFLSFVFTYALTPYFIRFCRATGIVGRDVMKRKRAIVADMGGPGVVTGFLTGVFFYIGMSIFLFG
jgi:UDP-N-acetylmuramyl pentapeptide phosphotransferase/UDP-N-acetylglucosamine-1-phosphate transferase